MLYNIGKKQEINPLDSVTRVCVAVDSMSVKELETWLHKQEKVKPYVVRVNPKWVLMWDISVLNFTTKLKWFSDKRGSFIFNNKEVHFHLIGETMTCF